MNLDSFDQVANLRDERAKLVVLHDKAREEPIRVTVQDIGGLIYVCEILPEAPFRSAIIETAADRIVAIHKELHRLGVRPPLFEIVEMDATGWRRTSEMYLRAWIRSLGGKLIRKAHLIDSLVLTTEDMVRHATYPWEPMSTAPKDGTPILVNFGPIGIHRVAWLENVSGTTIWSVEDGKHGPYPLRGYLDEDQRGWMHLLKVASS